MILRAQFTNITLFNEEHIRICFRYCRGRIGSIIEHRNILQHRAGRIYVHHLPSPMP